MREEEGDLLEEAAALWIFTGTKAAVLRCCNDGLLALWTVDGRPIGEWPES